MPTTINPASSSIAMTYLQKPEAVEPQRANGADLRSDGDQDDRNVAATPSRPQPTTNAMGQPIGTLLNTTA